MFRVMHTARKVQATLWQSRCPLQLITPNVYTKNRKFFEVKRQRRTRPYHRKFRSSLRSKCSYAFIGITHYILWKSHPIIVLVRRQRRPPQMSDIARLLRLCRCRRSSTSTIRRGLEGFCKSSSPSPHLRLTLLKLITLQQHLMSMEIVGFRYKPPSSMTPRTDQTLRS